MTKVKQENLTTHSAGTGFSKKLLSTALISTLLFSLSAFAQSDDVKVPPRKGNGKVTIISEPSGSDVYLGGELLGKSPIVNKNFKAGRHTLVIVDQGHELVNVRFNVWPDKVNEFNSKTDIPRGHLEITTIQSKCMIYVDGESVVKTDGVALTVKNLEAGEHTVYAVCSNVKSPEMSVNVKANETFKISIDVKAKKKK